MGFDWDTTGLSGAEFIEADDLMEGVDAAEGFVNKGIIGAIYGNFRKPDTEVDGYIDTKRILKPEFFGSPSPRMNAVSSTVHWRQTNQNWQDGAIFQEQTSGNTYAAIPGTCTRIKNKDRVECIFMASYYCFEFGGINRPHEATGTEAYKSYEGHSAGDVYVQVDGEVYGSTRRTVYTGLIRPCLPSKAGAGETRVANGLVQMSMIGRHQHSVMLRVELSPGVHDIGLVFKAKELAIPYPIITGEDDGVHLPGKIQTGLTASYDRDFPYAKHIFFLARNIVADCMYIEAGTFNESAL